MSGIQAIAAPRGGDNRHMHEVLDGLKPAEAIAAVGREFTGWKLHLSDTLAVWAETTMGPGSAGAPVTLRAANAEAMWREIAAEEHRWSVAAAAIAWCSA